MKLKIAYFYPKLLNLYGDNGNVEILIARAKARDIETEVIEISTDTQMTSETLKNINIAFMGGGPDSGQKSMYEDLVKNKGPYLHDFIENGGAGESTGGSNGLNGSAGQGGVGLYICGAYQLLGSYYKSADGSILEGLKIFDLYTQHFGNHKPRCIGNMVAEINPKLRHDITFNSLNKIGSELVGFENHGGRTYLGSKMEPLATIIKGYGNNGEDKTEGCLYKNSIGTYLHGPILSKNPHLADYLIAKSLNIDELTPLADTLIDDNFIKKAHTASKNLSQ